MNLRLPSLFPCYMFCSLNWPLSFKTVTFPNISPEHCKTSLQVLKKGSLYYMEGFSDGSVVKKQKQNCLPMQEMWAQSLVWEEPLEKGIATHSGFLAW